MRISRWCQRSDGKSQANATSGHTDARKKLAILFSAIIVESRPKTSRRGGRVAEGGGLLNRYRVKSSIGGSNPPLSARIFKTKEKRALPGGEVGVSRCLPLNTHSTFDI